MCTMLRVSIRSKLGMKGFQDEVVVLHGHLGDGNHQCVGGDLVLVDHGVWGRTFGMSAMGVCGRGPLSGGPRVALHTDLETAGLIRSLHV